MRATGHQTHSVSGTPLPAARAFNDVHPGSRGGHRTAPTSPGRSQNNESPHGPVATRRRGMVAASPGALGNKVGKDLLEAASRGGRPGKYRGLSFHWRCKKTLAEFNKILKCIPIPATQTRPWCRDGAERRRPREAVLLGIVHWMHPLLCQVRPLLLGDGEACGHRTPVPRCLLGPHSHLRETLPRVHTHAHRGVPTHTLHVQGKKTEALRDHVPWLTYIYRVRIQT